MSVKWLIIFKILILLLIHFSEHRIFLIIEMGKNRNKKDKKSNKTDDKGKKIKKSKDRKKVNSNYESASVYFQHSLN